MIIHVTADPTGTVSSHAAISDAIASIGAMNLDPAEEVVIQLGPGTFRVDATLVLPKGVTLAGHGDEVSHIVD